MKRLFDIIASGCGLIILSPLLLVLAIWIKLDSKGPVFYRQVRVGRHNRDFRIFKFRSMRVGADKGSLVTIGGRDPRITSEKVKALADAADACWKAILAHDLAAFAAAYKDSFEAQIAMFPGMVNPSINGVIEPDASVQPLIDRYSCMEDVLAWKMPGAGGGGISCTGGN